VLEPKFACLGSLGNDHRQHALMYVGAVKKKDSHFQDAFRRFLPKLGYKGIPRQQAPGAETGTGFAETGV
jgi:hypothetical protein